MPAKLIHSPRLAAQDVIPDRLPERLFPLRRIVVPLLLAGLVIGGAILRAHQLDRYGLELDEFWNAELSTGRGTVHERVIPNEIYTPPPATSLRGAPPWWEIPASLDNVAHPPLFSIVLRWWRTFVPDNDYTLRLLGVLLSASAIVPFYAAVALLSGRAAAAWSAAILAVASTPITIAQQVRPYNLLLPLLCLAFWQMLRIKHRGASWWSAALLGLTCLAAVTTHYFSVPILLAAAVYAAWGASRQTLIRCAACVVLAAVIFLVWWGPKLLQQRATLRESATTWLKETEPDPIAATLGRAATVPVRLLMAALPSSRGMVQLGIVIVPLAAILARRRSDMRFWLLILGGSLGFITFLDLLQGTKMLSLMRYSLPAAPAVIGIIAAALMRPGHRLGHVLPAAVFLGAVIHLPGAYEPVEPDYRPYAAYLDENVGERDVVVFPRKPGWTWYAGFLYATWSHYSTRPPTQCLFLDGDATEQLVQRLRAAPAVWLVSRNEQEGGAYRIPGLRVVQSKSFLYAADVVRCQFDPPASAESSP